MTAPVEQSAGPAGFLTRKIGPLSAWVWILIAVAILYAVVKLRGSKSAATDTASTPTDAVPPTVFQDYVTITPPAMPPAGGRVDPPATSPTAPPAGGTAGSSRTGSGPTAPTGTAISATPTPHPSSSTVTVARYTTSNPPWNSTLTGIASHEGYGGDWQAIWNAPANSALKSRRKAPDKIQPGDKIIVPAK